MKRTGLILLFFLVFFLKGAGQAGISREGRMFFHGIIRDAETLSPLANSRIIINRIFDSVSDQDGSFSFWGNRHDSVIFSQLGYKPAIFHISDTLSGNEFLTGIYLKTDTINIGEVIIIPKLSGLKYSILNTPVTTSTEIENARYNMAVSAYQGKISQGNLGDPLSNYNIIHQKQRQDAYEKGGIPSDRIAGLSPLMILPAAYLILNGLPPKPAPMNIPLTKQELDQIHKKYLETLKSKQASAR